MRITLYLNNDLCRGGGGTFVSGSDYLSARLETAIKTTSTGDGTPRPSVIDEPVCIEVNDGLRSQQQAPMQRGSMGKKWHSVYSDLDL